MAASCAIQEARTAECDNEIADHHAAREERDAARRVLAVLRDRIRDAGYTMSGHLNTVVGAIANLQQPAMDEAVDAMLAQSIDPSVPDDPAMQD